MAASEPRSSKRERKAPERLVEEAQPAKPKKIKRTRKAPTAAAPKTKKGTKAGTTKTKAAASKSKGKAADTKGKKAAKGEKGPTRPRPSYCFFVKDMRPQIVKSHPDLNFSQIAAAVAEKWKKLSPSQKAVYVKMAEEDKVRFEEESKAASKKK